MFNGDKIKTEPRTEKLWLLDVIRGFSALLIVLYHYTTQYDISIGHIVPYAFKVPWGCHAVYTFFLLSGFLTLYSYNEKNAALVFLKKRFLRLYPMFWVCMVVTTVYMFFLLPDRVPFLKQFIFNITMVPSFFGFNAVDGVYWTLAKELMFYFGFAAVILFGGINSKKYLWLWLWLILELFCTFFSQGGISSALLISEHLFAFLAGCAVFYLNHSGSSKERCLLVVYILICILLCAKMHSMDIVLVFVVSLCVLVIGSQENSNSKFSCVKSLFSPVLFLSEISYVLYLTHQFIGFGLIHKMETRGFTAEAWVLLPIAHAVMLAALLHYGVEIKINHVLKKYR